EKPWPPEPVLQLLIRLLASMLLGMVLVSWLTSASWLPKDEVKFLTILVGTISFHGVGLVLIHQFLREQSVSWEEVFGFASPRIGRALLLALLVAMAVLPIAWSLGQLSARVMSSFNIQPVIQSPVQILQTAVSLPTKLLIGFLAIIVAPF